MAIDGSEIVKVLSGYVHWYPDETMALMPLYDATRDHVVRGACLHSSRCPIVKAGALLVDERERVLALRNGDRFCFAEGAPEPGDATLSETARRVLRECAGVYDAWAVTGVESPLIIDVQRAAREDGPRLRVGFRYLFRAHSGAVFPAMVESGQARWVPLDDVDDRIAHRLQSGMAVAQ